MPTILGRGDAERGWRAADAPSIIANRPSVSIHRAPRRRGSLAVWILAGACLCFALPGAASMSDDDGVSINIRRPAASLPGAAPTPLAAATSTPAKGPAKKGKRPPLSNGARGTPRPTAETFGEDFSGMKPSAKGGAARRHGDGGVTLAPAHGSSKPWERKPNAKNVKKVEPTAAKGSEDKNCARVRLGKAGAANPHDTSTFSVDSFGDAALKLLPAIVGNLQHKFGASAMTHVQRGSVPAILQGADVLLRARTGTGKTLAYLVPIVQYLADRPARLAREQGTHALIVVPTRELAVQVHDVLTNLLRPFHWLVPGILMGGEKKKSEKARIRKGLHVITATPGRLTDHMSSTECLNVHPIQFLVLDEADRLMDLGFEKDVTKICSFVKDKRDDFVRARLQTILVSATLDGRVKQLASTALSNPLLVSDDQASRVPLVSLSCAAIGLVVCVCVCVCVRVCVCVFVCARARVHAAN